MISCISLAYNINCVGNLVSNLRTQKIKKNKQYKIFDEMNDINKVSQEL
jgi:hypothetical protein